MGAAAVRGGPCRRVGRLLPGSCGVLGGNVELLRDVAEERRQLVEPHDPVVVVLVAGRPGGEEAARPGARRPGAGRGANDVLDQPTAVGKTELVANLQRPSTQVVEPAICTTLCSPDYPVLELGSRQGACDLATATA